MNTSHAHVVVMMLSAAAMLSGCGGAGPRSTQHESTQVVAATEDLRDALAGSTFLAGRTESSPEYRLLVDRLENFSSDRMTRTEQLLAVGRVVSDDGMLQFLRSRNVRVIFVRDDVDTLTNLGLRNVFGAGAQPSTHALRARFYSATRFTNSAAAPADGRSDDFMLMFTIADLSTGEQVWSGSTRFKNAAKGRQID